MGNAWQRLKRFGLGKVVAVAAICVFPIGMLIQTTDNHVAAQHASTFASKTNDRITCLNTAAGIRGKLTQEAFANIDKAEKGQAAAVKAQAAAVQRIIGHDPAGGLQAYLVATQDYQAATDAYNVAAVQLSVQRKLHPFGAC